MSVRESTEGMVNALGKKAWIVDYRDQFGRRRQVKTNATSMKEARQIEAAILSKIQKAKDLDVPVEALDGTSFTAFVDGTYLPLIKQKIRQSTVEGYENACRDLKDFFGTMRLSSIQPTTLDSYFEDRKKTLGLGTLKNRLHRLNAIFSMAQRKRVILYNPCDGVERWNYAPAPKEALTPEQEEALMDAVREEDAWVKPIITWGLYGGMRVSEIIKTRWEHIKDGLIHIPKENAKNKKPRAVPLSSEMEAAIAPLQARRLAEGSEGWVFWNAPVKSPYTRQHVYHAYKRAAKAAKISASTFHATRVTLITDARESGRISDAKLAAIVGHGADGRMLSHYTRIKDESLKGATEGLRRTKDARQTQDAAVEG